MTTIIFNANIPDGANELMAAIEELCAVREIQLDIRQLGNDVCLMVGNKQPTGQLAGDLPSVDEPIADIAATLASIPAEMPTEIPAEIEMPTEIPAPSIQSIGCAIIPSLHSGCTIEAMIDSSSPCSILYAGGVQCVGDYVMFNYCDVVFKYPLNVNDPAQVYFDMPTEESAAVEDKKIRVVVQMCDSQNMYPVDLKVCEKVAGQPCSLWFGSDTPSVQAELAG